MVIELRLFPVIFPEGANQRVHFSEVHFYQTIRAAKAVPLFWINGNESFWAS
jgi:hypothetical protein